MILRTVHGATNVLLQQVGNEDVEVIIVIYLLHKLITRGQEVLLVVIHQQIEVHPLGPGQKKSLKIFPVIQELRH